MSEYGEYHLKKDQFDHIIAALLTIAARGNEVSHEDTVIERYEDF